MTLCHFLFKKRSVCENVEPTPPRYNSTVTAVLSVPQVVEKVHSHLSLKHFFSSLRFKFPPQPSNQVKVWTLTGSLYHLHSFLFFLLLLQICCCAWDYCCMTHFWPCLGCWKNDFTFDPRILWCTKRFTVDSMTAKCPGPAHALSPKSASTSGTPPPYLTIGMRCFFLQVIE